MGVGDVNSASQVRVVACANSHGTNVEPVKNAATKSHMKETSVSHLLNPWRYRAHRLVVWGLKVTTPPFLSMTA